MKRIADPKLPSEKEEEDHCLRGHLPYRNWCPICVRAKGRGGDHKKDGAKEKRIPEYQ